MRAFSAYAGIVARFKGVSRRDIRANNKTLHDRARFYIIRTFDFINDHDNRRAINKRGAFVGDISERLYHIRFSKNAGNITRTNRIWQHLYISTDAKHNRQVIFATRLNAFLALKNNMVDITLRHAPQAAERRSCAPGGYAKSELRSVVTDSSPLIYY